MSRAADALDRARYTASMIGGPDPIFIADHRFEAGKATMSRAGHIVLVTATPEWWSDTFGLNDTDQFQGGKRPPPRYCDIPIQRLDQLTSHRDWPLVMEAIIRLKLVDFSAIFR